MSLRCSQRASLSQVKKRSSKEIRAKRQFAVEPLEHRNLLTLLGVTPSFPTITYDSTGVINYNSTTHHYDLTASPLVFKASAIASPNVITTPRSVVINIQLDNSGNLLNDFAVSDMTVTGVVVGNPGLSGTLLTAKVIAFGNQFTGSGTDNYDLIAIPTGGTLFSMFAGQDVGMTIAAANSTFNNSFNHNFTGGAKGTIGSVPLFTGNISGNKFNDITGNGFSGDDTGLGGVSINLYRDLDNSGTLTPGDGPAIATTTTAAGSGAYSFTNLLPGTYFVQEVVPSGEVQTAGGTYTVNVTSGSNTTGRNFDDFKLINISGTKFNDITGNGFSPDDTGLGGVTINLYLNGGSTPVASTVTAANGSYSFNNLGPGSYFVQEAVPAGSTQTGGNAGYTINATSGSNSTGNNFGNFSNIAITGSKFNDLTGNGFSADDTPLGGVTINLYLNGGSTPIASTVTAVDGSYAFNNLGPGTYYVQETIPAGWTQTGGTGGYTIVTTSGSGSSGNNFDDFQNISLSGVKYKDNTGDGITGDDTGLGGVTINLYLNGGSTPVASTVTAANGSYSFSNLGPGNYSVQEVVPAGSTQTAGNAGYTVVATSGSNSSNNNFANFTNISISGTKFNDLTGNSFSGDDTGLGGVTINLYLNGGSTPVASTVTAADGSYSFSNLGPGSYSVQEVVPAGSTQTGGLGGYTVSATSGSNSSGNNFDNFQNITISGTKFNDLTGNSFSGDDTGLGGVTINLYLNGGSTPVASTVTAADGSYSFTNLGPGTYSVQEVVPAGSTQTGGLGGYTVSATSGSNSTGNNFDNFQNITISGTKFNDLTGNSFSGDDTGLGGVTINLYLNGGSTPVASTVTAADGSYSFTNLGPGSYSVQEVVPAGSTQTGGLGGYTVSATSGSNSTGNNFDNFQNISISGVKFNDLTGNSFSGDDTGLGGVTINLYLNGGSTPVASTVTAADGSYSFTNLGPGTYSVQEVVPAGSTQTGGLGGYTVSATSGSNSTGNNFDNFQNISISGTKFNDVTGNSFSGDDTGLGGVTINLYLNGGSTPVASTVTAADGSYSFSNLGPGSYSVQEVVPAGSTQTGGLGGYTVSATSGSNSSNNNFANFTNISISGTKFNDLTGNSFSGDDTGLGGVTINLYLNGGSTPVASTVTAADGSYSFSNLGPGSYSVQEVVPAGSTQTGGLGGYTVSAISGSNSSGNNFDNFQNITISGTKFNDLTGNSFSGDDTGLGGVTINLYLNGGSTPVASTVTAADGSYSFTNLGPGSYSVQEVVPAGSTQTGGLGGYTVSATSGSNSSGNNFDNFQNITISGTKFNDLTGNSFSGDDTGLGGVTINLYLNGGSTPVASTVTAADGSYSFTNLGPGSYSVQEVVPAGSTQTGGLGGYTVSATSGSNSTGNNFDNFQNISINGVKFNDITGDGFSADDTPLGGVTINLYRNGSGPVASTVTAADGSYSFTNLGPGTYYVQEAVPAGYTQTGGTHSSAYTFTAHSGQNVGNFNFDDFQNITISGTKFNDLTGNSFSGDDTGLGGVTIYLYLNGEQPPIASTVTAADGSYSFSNLGPGMYTVQEVTPAGSTQTGGLGGYTINATSGVNSSGNNFDNFTNINISGAKFNDITGNSFSGDDVGQGGVTINLYLNGGSTPVASTVTAADGSYSFSNLGPGSYSVQEVVPAGSTQTGGLGGYTISATSGSNSSGNNFDNFANITISGTKFNDLTGNSFSGDDVGQGGVTVNLYKNGGSTPVATTVTAADGSYSFSNLGPGSYSVQEVVPAGSTQTGGLGGYTISATSGSNSSGNNFDNFQNITISGTKFNDITGNSFSADDTGLGGVTINLYKNGGSTPVASTVTAANGSYSFTNLGPGSYSVQEVVPAGSTQTGGLGGYTISATSGSNSSGNNFDDFQNISISGTKFNDITGNSFSADDTPLGGVTINLYKNGGSTPVATTVTAANGTYSFANLGPGTYSVQEVVPAGSVQTGGIGGYTIVANSGANATGKNFDDYFSTSTISGTKFNDITGNSFSADDTGLGGVTINLYKNGGSTPVATTVTASNGSFSFSNLGPGTYSVQEVVPSGSTQTGGIGGYTFVLTSGQNSSGNNFDDFQNICISGTKYNDCTGNGIDSGDTGLGGVTINLYKNGGSTPVATTVTASNGSYQFNNLGPGSYTVQEVVPSGWTQTAGIGGYSISASSGNNASGKNFADFDNISISGKKYNDLTGNCITSDDTPLGGVTIQLFKNGGTTPVATTVTASDGTYSFTNLGPGTYTVKELVPAGSVQTVGMGGYTINASSGNDVSGKNFADYFTSASIKGNKYLDVTGNGLTGDDTGMGGVTIKLYKDVDNNNTLTSADGAAVATTTSASGTGAFAFNNLAPGTYFVQEVVPTGYIRTAPTNSDTYIIHVTSGSTSTGVNFANAAICTCDSRLTDISYLINGSTVVTDLRGHTNQGDLVQVTFTVSSGTPITLSLVSYTAPGATFDANVASQQQIFDTDTGTFGPGTYTLTVHIPDSFYQVDFVCGTPIDHFGPAGSNIFYSAQCRLFSADNDGCAAVLTNGSSIAGNVYADTANYGVFDANESGIAYTQVKLTGTTTSGQSVSITAFTAPDGSYIFNNLLAGTYKITEVQPVGYADGADTAGTAGGSVSNDVISNIVIGANVNATNYNFGEKPDVVTASAASSTSAALAAVNYQADVLKSGYSMLVISGTTGADTIAVTCNTSGRYTVTINGSSANFNNTDSSGHAVDLIVINGFGGYNTITVNSSITTATAIFGGNDGNKITGGSGYNVIVGGTGADNLIGGSNRDVLIGSGGADTINGNGGDDILVAGSTSYNNNLGALESIMAEWSSSRTYAERVANLTGTGTSVRLNGAFFLIDGWTVFDDGAQDTLTGGSGTDWYLANKDTGVLDVITDLATGEFVTDVG